MNQLNSAQQSPILVPFRPEWPHIQGCIKAEHMFSHKDEEVLSEGQQSKVWLYLMALSQQDKDPNDQKLTSLIPVLAEGRGSWFQPPKELQRAEPQLGLPEGLRLRLEQRGGEYWLWYHLTLLDQGSERSSELMIPSLSIAMAPASYNSATRPIKNVFKNLNKPQIKLRFPAVLLKADTTSLKRATLCADLGSQGNTMMAVHVGSSQPIKALTTPLMVGDSYEEIDLSKERQVQPRFKDHLRAEQATSFSSSYIQEHESVGPQGGLMGERADSYLKDGKWLNGYQGGFSWSVKSQLHKDELYRSWLSAVRDGLYQKIPLSEGRTRQELQTRSEGLIEPSSTYHRISASFPNTYLASMRNDLKEHLAQTFKVKSDDVSVRYDEATAGSIGWFTGRYGHDMNPSRLLSMMSEESLFAPLDSRCDQEDGLKTLAALSKPLHFLVIDAGASTTDIALLQVAYDGSSGRVVAQTIGKQGFNTGGLEISKALCADWKRELRYHLESKVKLDSTAAKEVLVTTISSSDSISDLSISDQERTRRNALLVALFLCAEEAKLMVSSGRSSSELMDQQLREVCNAINAHSAMAELPLEVEELTRVIKPSLERVNEICVKTLGPSLCSAADLPVQYDVRRLDAILMLGRTLRLPHLTTAFLSELKRKAQERAEQTGEDWSELVPPPHCVHSWNQDRLAQEAFNAKSDLHPHEDKRCVSLGLAMIEASSQSGVDHFRFEPHDKQYRQRFVGAKRLEGKTWHKDLVEGVQLGQRPEEFSLNSETLYHLDLHASSTEVELFWNNTGTHSAPAHLEINGQRHKISKEEIIDLGVLSFEVDAELKDQADFRLYFKLVEDGRVWLHSVELRSGDKELGRVAEDHELELVKRFEQRLEGDRFTVRYKEVTYDPDFRNSGIIDHLDNS